MIAPWIIEEMKTLDLEDQRRNQRAQIILDGLAQIAESQPDAAKSTAALKATYRFVDNKFIDLDRLLTPHNQSSIARTTKYRQVILANDTTEFDLTKPNCQIDGAGPLESNDKFGFYFHPLYALTPEGLAIGAVDQVIWTRESIRLGLSKEEKDRLRKQTAFEEKESQRWLAMFQSGEQIARANPGTEYVIVGDSESDIHEVFAETRELPKNYHFVIRAAQDRAIVNGGKSLTVDAVLASAPLKFTSKLEISERVSKITGETRARRKSREARLADVSVRAVSVTIRGPARPGGRLPDVKLNVVDSVELDPPAGEDPIRWVLLTTLPIDSRQELLRVIESYRCRWNIELYFKTLKSGLKTEDLRYETLERYLKAFALFIVIAWRVEYLKGAARLDGEASCEKYFKPEEWQPAYLVYHDGERQPVEPPTMMEFMLMIAELGGWQRKKTQGPPGSTTIWRGIRKMEAYADAFQVFKKAEKRS
ncbi:MAG: family transposase, partial [Planctomycetaceae bacterium]|nr:family transposase [Planctomycetaceae bacterium]